MRDAGRTKGRRGRRVSVAGLLSAALAAWVGSAGAAASPETPPSPEAAITALEGRIVAGATLAELVNLGYLASPMVRAARAEWRAVVEKYRVDTAWANPELMLEGMYPTDTLGDTLEPMDWTIGLSQAVPLWGRQGAAGDVSRAEAQVAKLKLEAAVRDLTYEIRRSAAELGYLAAAREIARGQQALVGKLVAAGAAAYAGERASLYEVMKARAQSGQVEYDVLLLEEAERAERARLNALLDRPAEAPIGPIAAEAPGAVVYSLAEIEALVEANAAGLAVARAEAARAEAMAKLVRYENLPEFTLGVSYGIEEEVEQLGLRASIMLPLHSGKNAGRTGAAQADIERMRAMERSRLNEDRARVREVAFRLRNAERLETLYRLDLVPQAERAVEIAQARLEQGQGDLGAAAEARSAWYSFGLALARARADRATLLASLESLAGRPLTERDAAAPAPVPPAESAK